MMFFIHIRKTLSSAKSASGFIARGRMQTSNTKSITKIPPREYSEPKLTTEDVLLSHYGLQLGVIGDGGI